MDEAYFEGECLVEILSEGLAAVSIQIGRLLKAFEEDKTGEWERDAIPQLMRYTGSSSLFSWAPTSFISLASN